ncbi:MAG: glycoside hydrolase family 9 protein [Prevotellaceae bacterium]|jgi:hypothetical protein|nr:glycoside hydrolase family 9 protein [Prevotellaceae bacterium]
MKISSVFLFVFLPVAGFGQLRLAQDSLLEQQIIQSGFIHSPLPLSASNAYDAYGLKKKILRREPLIIRKDLNNWTHTGLGEMSFSSEKSFSGTGSLKMTFPTFTGQRAKGSPSDPDYATYGQCRVRLDAKKANWEKYNRIVFYIYPDGEGARIVNLNFSFENKNTAPKAGSNVASVSHLVNLVNGQWNQCFLDVGEVRRDEVAAIGFSCSIKGKDRTSGEQSVYYIDNIELQAVDDPETVSGWKSGNGKLIYSTTGYSVNGQKTAIVNKSNQPHAGNFQLLDAAGNAVFNGAITRETTTLGTFDIADFTTFRQSGDYRLKVDERITPPFQIGDNIWENSLWRVLNFIFCQRCGYPVPGKHGTCHLDLYSKHDEKMISYAGGWHDAGDLSQQTLQTGDVTYALLEAYTKLKEKNPPLAMRLLEEAEWGLEFILRNRYGDGYRASSMGLLIWQDGINGTLDDISSVRVQNLPFDNFLYAAYEAYAAMTIVHDPMLQEYLQRVAKEDFAFAMKQHAETGFGGFIHLYEHSYNTSESQYMATISWAASMLYQLTGEAAYAGIAADYIRYTLSCQRKEPLGAPNGIRGFFYRDTARISIVHYIHQSREQVYMQALALLCETQPKHPEYPQWAEAIRLHGDYLKKLAPYTAPYGMLPSGVYHLDEHLDSAAFYHLHLFPPDDAKERYVSQVKNGAPLDGQHYVKRFPVWFSIFNGNTAVHLSMGKAAAICGKFLHDEELLHIGQEQLYWTVGKNPFGQSLIYGEGHNYPQMDSFSSGEMTGEMPVGIRSLGDEDVPYWPATNNACYKEVWVTSAGKWLLLATEY